MNRSVLLEILPAIGCIDLLILYAHWQFNAVMDADLPDWIKHLILR